SASGGDVVDVTKLDTSLGERYHMWPSFLPDGRHFLYLAWVVGLKGEMTHATLYVGSTDPQEPRPRLMDSVSMAFYAKPGYLIYGTAQNALAARPFDAERLRFTGEAATIVDSVQLFPTGRLGADASEDGTLIYRTVVALSSPAPFAWQNR